ncbi:testis development-related protein isoform X2 [Phyllopteryx taeniolatus]|uniref:testis development-related protein isoform X2 n=1 Tax=Phyllopteryx taeniolatus TaxID=161469 RepID=UPI002AD3C1E1|nr:testis development-related protein isoform X2 [Phyllopteryx taeniolatus]
MFRRSKSQVLVDYASEEDDTSCRYEEAKVKKMMSKKERKDKKMFSSKDDEHFLLTRETPAQRRGNDKKVKCEKPDKALCFWESVTMTMRQISPAKKTDKAEGRETPRPRRDDGAPKEDDGEPNGRSSSPPLVDPSGFSPDAEDSSRYADLSRPDDPACAVTWTSRAKVKLAGLGRMSRGIVSDGAWEGLK